MFLVPDKAGVYILSLFTELCSNSSEMTDWGDVQMHPTGESSQTCFRMTMCPYWKEVFDYTY